MPRTGVDASDDVYRFANGPSDIALGSGMDCYLCSVDPSTLKLLEHENAEWLTWRDFNKMDWMEADKKVVEAVKAFFKEAERKIM